MDTFHSRMMTLNGSDFLMWMATTLAALAATFAATWVSRRKDNSSDDDNSSADDDDEDEDDYDDDDDDDSSEDDEKKNKFDVAAFMAAAYTAKRAEKSSNAILNCADLAAIGVPLEAALELCDNYDALRGIIYENKKIMFDDRAYWNIRSLARLKHSSIEAYAGLVARGVPHDNAIILCDNCASLLDNTCMFNSIIKKF